MDILLLSLVSIELKKKKKKTDESIFTLVVCLHFFLPPIFPPLTAPFSISISPALVICDSCRDALRHSEYAAGAHWVWPHRLVTTVHHQTPNYQLTPEPTPTCLKAQWPAPLQSAPVHTALTPTASKPCPVLSKHAPRDAPWLHDIQMLRDILSHLRLSVLSVRPLNFTKEDKVNFSVFVPGRAQCGYNNSSFGVTEKDMQALALRLKK